MTRVTTRLTELKAVAEKATPGPWAVEETKDSGEYGDYLVHGVHPIATATWYSDSAYAHTALDEMALEDATHIATFDPPTVLALIAALEGVMALIDEHARREAHNEMVPLNRISDLRPEPISEEYRRVITDALGVLG